MSSENKKAQIVKCRCGKVFAACMEPECYTDKDWQRDVRKYANGGCTVHLVVSDSFRFEVCKCDKFTNHLPVAEVAANQLTLFKN